MFNCNLYFRLKGQNANIYRLAKDNRRPGGDIFEHIGVLVMQNGKIKLKDGEVLTADEEAEISSWRDRQIERAAENARYKAQRLIPEMNLITHWIQSEAADEDINQIFEELMLALTDLRETAIRRYAKARLDTTQNHEK